MTDFLKSHRKELALLCVSLFLSFIILESLVRITYRPYLGGWYGYPAELFLPDEVRGYRYRPNFKGFFPNPQFDNISIDINSRGLRDVEHELEPEEGIVRILGLGDSVTFGSGVAFEDSYLRQLEEMSVQNGVRLEIIKAGVNSYEFDQYYSYYRDEGYRYRPDIVLVGLVLNDIVPVTPDKVAQLKEEHAGATTSSESRGSASFKEIAKRLCRTCLLVKRLAYPSTELQERDYANRTYFDAVMGEWEKEWPSFRNKLLSLSALVRENGSQLLIVVFPYTEQFSRSENLTRLPQEKLAFFSQESGVPVLDLLPILDRPGYEELYLPGDNVHLNQEGYGTVSTAIYEEFKRRGMI